MNLSDIARYNAFLTLLIKYGRSDIVRDAGLGDPSLIEDTLPDSAPDPEELARDLEERGPAYVKLGQLLSTRPDILPAPYRAALSRLQDDVESIEFANVSEIVADSLGVRVSNAFQSFDESPYACASIGQVHRATLRDGRDVAVKVQRPDIREPILRDLDVFAKIAALVDRHTDVGRRIQFGTIVDSLKESLLRELDYTVEARNAALLRENLKEFSGIAVPEIMPDFCSSRVLTSEFLPGTKITEVSQAVLIERDTSGLAEHLFRAYLKQILVDGFFHADPHPGNLLLLRDGRIGLLDAGMVSIVGERVRSQLVRLMLALSEADGEAAADVALELNQSEDRDNVREPAFRRAIGDLVAEHHRKPVEKLQAGTLVFAIQSAAGECGVELPREVILLGKTLMNLDEVVTHLDPQFNPHEVIRKSATEILSQHTTGALNLTSLMQAFLESTELLRSLPHRVNRITELLANNDMRLHVDAIDEHKLLVGMEKVANRITTGLILAALIVGASLMMRLKTDWTLFGYPAIAMVFFLFAACAGCYLVVRAMFVDRDK